MPTQLKVPSQLPRLVQDIRTQADLNRALQRICREARPSVLEAIRPHLPFTPLDIETDVPWERNNTLYLVPPRDFRLTVIPIREAA